jgi:hypothetical protein
MEVRARRSRRCWRSALRRHRCASDPDLAQVCRRLRYAVVVTQYPVCESPDIIPGICDRYMLSACPLNVFWQDRRRVN